MSLWVDLYGFDDDDRYGDTVLSGPAKRLIDRDIIPLRRWTFGDETFIMFQSSQWLHVAVSAVSRYIADEFGAIARLENKEDFEFNNRFTVSFTDNR